MTFGYIPNVPQVKNYLSAVMLEGQIKPIRGRATSTKPLASRRQDQLTIRKDADNIVIKLYATDIIKFKPCGEIEVFLGNCGMTRTTVSVISDVLWWYDARLVHDNVWYKGQKLHSNEINYFKDNILQNPATIDVYDLNKKAFTQTNRKYKEFRAYFRMIEKLGEGWGERYNRRYRDVPQFISNVSGELGIEGFYEAGVSIARNGGFKTLLKCIKHHHRDEVFIKTTQLTMPTPVQHRNYLIYIND
jgi:hypothetical protein